MNRRTLLLAFVALVCSPTPHALAGPMQSYYLADGDNKTVFVVQGNAVVNTWALRDNQYPIAVADTVRAYATYSSNTGSEYTLGGVYTGTDYPFQGDPGQSLDGTTDGAKFNYLVSFNDRGVYQFDRDWKSPVLLFAVPNRPIGITYDPTTGNLWVSTFAPDGIGGFTSTIAEYTTAGALLGSFSGGSGRLGALAYEPGSDTLWGLVNQSTEIRQFSKTGTLLESVLIPGLSGNIFGGEFALITAGSTGGGSTGGAPVPEPATCAVLGALVLGGLGFYRRRMRTGAAPTPAI